MLAVNTCFRNKVPHHTVGHDFGVLRGDVIERALFSHVDLANNASFAAARARVCVCVGGGAAGTHVRSNMNMNMNGEKQKQEEGGETTSAEACTTSIENLAGNRG